MDGSEGIDNNLDEYLDILGQQPGLHKLYTQICLCFPVADSASYDSIFDTLNSGFRRLSASFPWVAGQVVAEDSGEGHPVVLKIRQQAKVPDIRIKDLRHDPSILTMEDLRRANFPSKMLHERLICPCRTFSAGTSESSVFIVQANVIKGGLLLTFNAQHNTTDMTGQGEVIRLFSKACRNEPFTAEELASGNLPRRDLIPYLDDSYHPGPELAHQIIKPAPPREHSPAAPTPPPHSTWAYFSFSAESLAILKSRASEHVTSVQGYVSTDDVLSAFIWQSVLRARMPRLDPKVETTFARAINVRSYLGVPATYPGLVQNMTYSTYPVKKLVEEPLGSVASQLRTALDPETAGIVYRTRALATMLHRSADKSHFSATANMDQSVDIALSSWALVNCYDLDFNLGLGKPEAVRRPEFDPVEGLFYLMPRRLDGEISALLCLRDEDLERLRADEQFAKHGVYIG